MADFILSQSSSFLAFFCCGFCAAAFYDFFRFLRRLLPHSSMAASMEDVFFWLAAGIAIFRLLVLFQSGRLRIFLPIAFLLGSGLWLISFSRLFLGPICSFFLFLKENIKNLQKNLKKHS